MSTGVGVVSALAGFDAGVGLARAHDAVRAASAAGARLVVFPEFTNAYDRSRALIDHAEPVGGPWDQALTEWAHRYRIRIIAGLLRQGTVPQKAQSIIGAWGPDGPIGAYQKIHLYDAAYAQESAWLESGSPTQEPLVFSVGKVSFGVMCCFDLRFPEVARWLSDAGAHALVVPAAWAAGPDKARQWRALLKARAIESTSYVIGAALQGQGLVGRSAIVDPSGKVIAPPPGAKPGDLVGAELDISVIDQARAQMPVLRLRQFEIRARG